MHEPFDRGILQNLTSVCIISRAAPAGIDIIKHGGQRLLMLMLAYNV